MKREKNIRAERREQRAQSPKPEMWLKPEQGNVECRLTNNEYRSEEKGNVEYRLTNNEYRSEEKGNIECRLTINDCRRGANNPVSYSLFLQMWLKPLANLTIPIRQLKLTACPDCSGAKDSGAKSNLSALSFAVDFSQRIRKYDVRIGLQPHSMWLKPVFDCNYSIRQLKQTAKDSAVKPAASRQRPAAINKNSTVFQGTMHECMNAIPDSTKLLGTDRPRKRAYRMRECENPELETRNPEPATNENSTVFHKPQFLMVSPSGGKSPKGKGVQFSPVIIDFSHEELAIRACDLLRYFNN